MLRSYKQFSANFPPLPPPLSEAPLQEEGLFREAVLAVEDLPLPEVELPLLVVAVTRAAEAVVVVLPPPVV